VGFNITLPHEQQPNPYATPDLSFRFHYFAMRKMHLAMRANALVVFPGGFGTFDELFEILTLRQTDKAPRIPIVLFDEAYWRSVINFDSLVEHGMINAADLELFRFAESAETVWSSLLACGLKPGESIELETDQVPPTEPRLSRDLRPMTDVDVAIIGAGAAGLAAAKGPGGRAAERRGAGGPGPDRRPGPHRRAGRHAAGPGLRVAAFGRPQPAGRGDRRLGPDHRQDPAALGQSASHRHLQRRRAPGLWRGLRGAGRAGRGGGARGGQTGPSPNSWSPATAGPRC
jgi:hypothetical protein